jgi:hypothetical protein
MDFVEASNRLWNHANYPGEKGPYEESLLGQLWESGRQNAKLDFGPLVENVLQCLESVNRETNGPHPQQVGGKWERFPRSLVETVAVIVHECNQYALEWEREGKFDSSYIADLRLSAWRISCAWCNVLAGDFDSIAQGVDDEARMIGLL